MSDLHPSKGVRIWTLYACPECRAFSDRNDGDAIVCSEDRQPCALYTSSPLAVRVVPLDGDDV